ncbi:hypothetical protein A6723_025000 [Pseudomonas sp. AU11447]|uniref:acyltransferase family protein n=1 Tax=unclassified Pseudomonas TaxID=196821 RepID=UPI0006D46EFF|nr:MULTISPECIES: acyltransferase [unclassified Pseudomonas]OBY91310.1 hypothetical protein A6723_025000 [Pseudomonas sp. AU11447]
MYWNSLGNLESTRSREDSNNFLLIRVVAALMVVAGHSLGLSIEGTPENLEKITYAGIRPHGLGVLIFFCISGFLVTGSICKRNSLKEYSISRLCRILPALWACIASTTLFAGTFLSSHPLLEFLQHPEFLNYVWKNSFLIAAQFSLPYVDLGKYGINGSLWTIPIEARLYLYIAVFYLVGALRNLKLFTVVLTIFWGLLVFDHLPLLEKNTETLKLTICFFSGCALFLLRHRIPASKRLALVITTLALLIYFSLQNSVLIYFAVGYLAILLAYSKKIPSPFGTADYSYGIYLYSFPIQQCIIHSRPEISAIELAIIAIPLSMLAAAASWHFVEKPFLDLKKSWLVKVAKIEKHALSTASTSAQSPDR